MIESIYLEEEVFIAMGIGMTELELTPPLSMSGLSGVVVLAGPNGGGKSRFLRMLPNLLIRKLSPEQTEEAIRRREMLELERRAMTQQIQTLSFEPQAHQRALQSLQFQLSTHAVELEAISRSFQMNDAVTTSDGRAPRFIRFVPNGYQLQDPFQLPQSESTNRASRFTTSIENSQGGAPAYAASVLRRATEEGYQRMRAGETASSVAEADEERLLSILQTLLGDDVRIALRDGQLRIGKYDPYWQTLSAGQQMLFQFGCLLHAQAEQVKNSIVLMDEPENHLHPGVLIQVIDSLTKLLSDGQLWIATHSVPLIAHLMSKEPDCLWYVNEGRVKRSGRTPEVVLESLLGGEQGARDLQALTQLPSSYAANRFLAECLVAPGTVGPDVKDPQTLQIRQALWDQQPANAEKRSKLRVLDFGAGKGRLLATLMDSLQPGQVPWFDYIAFDPSPGDKADCVKQIELSYGSSTDRLFDSLDVLAARLNKGSFDAVVMCNVLHEVDPADWVEMAKSCASLLKDSGSLVLVEDYGIPVGERAHNYGFLLLDEPELVELFAIQEQDRAAGRFSRASSPEVRYKDRLVIHVVAKECVGRLTASTRKSAIEKLHERMSRHVREWLRNPTTKSSSGRDYARSAQLMANSELWMRDNG